VFEPLTPGITVVLPGDPAAPQDSPGGAPAADPDAVSIALGGQRFRHWSQYTITRQLDGVSAIDLKAPFDEGSLTFRTAFLPGQFRPLTVLVGGEPLFAGTAVKPKPTWTEEERSVQISGYGTPGVLQDCTLPVSAFPLEFNDVALEDIAARLCEPFSIGVAVEADTGGPFTRVAMKPTDKPWKFLADLAQQRGIVLGDTPTGELALRKSATIGSPVATLLQGSPPVTGLSMDPNPQAYYSSVSAIAPSKAGKTGASSTIRNPYLPAVVRPLTVEAKDADGVPQVAALSRAARMFGELATFKVDLVGWRNPTGELWAPNSTVALFAPGIMVYDVIELLVRVVRLSRDDEATTAQLDLVIPEAFAAALPESYLWAP
jgi:prophage tail gpP-like protein